MVRPNMAISCCFTSGILGQSPISISNLSLMCDSLEQELKECLPDEGLRQNMCLTVLKCSQIRVISLTQKSNETLSMERGLNTILPKIEQTPVCIQNESSILKTIVGMEATVISSIQSILTDFLRDQAIRTISLTFLDGAGGLITRSWTKELVIPSCGHSR